MNHLQEIVINNLKEDNRRDIYMAKDGTYWMTYGGGQVHAKTFLALKNSGQIIKAWPDKSDEMSIWVLPENVNRALENLIALERL
jgi:hypothetical protein